MELDDSPFAAATPYPKTDRDALLECVEVLERINRDNLLVGAGSILRNTKGKIERPLAGCANRALEHAKIRLGHNYPIKGGVK